VVRTPVKAPADPVVPAAGWILRQIGVSAAEPLSAAIVGPGGTGKSTLLKAIANAYSETGVRVARAGPDTARASGPAIALVTSSSRRCRSRRRRCC